MTANAVKSAGNVTVSYNSNDLESYCDTAQIAAQLSTIDVTNLASTAAEWLTGFADWSIPIGGPWDATLDGFLAPDAVTPGTKRDCVMTLTDAASTTITYTWTANAEIQDYNITSAPTEAIKWTATLKLSGAPNRA
jgi:hypothetical protein